MLTGFFKRNSILIVYAILCVVVAALVMVELDKQYYQARKKTFMQDNWDWYNRDQARRR